MPLTFSPNANPETVAKITARHMKVMKPTCRGCGKYLPAKDLRAGRDCLDVSACRLRRITHPGYNTTGGRAGSNATGSRWT